MGNCDCSVVKPERTHGLPRKPEAGSKFGDGLGDESSSLSDGSTASDILKAPALVLPGKGQGPPSRNGARSRAESLATEESSDNETEEEPQWYAPSQIWRKGAVSSEAFQRKGYYKERFWNKTAFQQERLFKAFRSLVVLRRHADAQIEKLVNAAEIHRRVAGSSSNELLAERGEPADGLFVVLSGAANCYSEGGELEAVKPEGSVIDEAALLWGVPRRWTMKAEGECVFGKLRRDDYLNICIRFEHQQRKRREELLKDTKLLEMMDPESIAKLAEVVSTRTYERGEHVIKQGERGKEFFVVLSGEAAAYTKTADDEQECMRYRRGDLFGENALRTDQKRARTIKAESRLEVMAPTREQFERLFGSIANLHAQQYLTDPRKLLADFYDSSDARGPRGSLELRKLQPDASLGETTWFAVYRPTSREAIAKMLSGVAVGKGLNVKGKSAKQGNLSGFVPFVQISDNKHKPLIEDSPPDSRMTVYYRTETSREEARRALAKVAPEVFAGQAVGDPEIRSVDEYAPCVFGLSLPETLLREAYIMRPDLSPELGWETGRRSEPFNMDANLHAARKVDDPRVVLYQHDESDAMNPRGLLVAYAEQKVKPVVSDFDTFLVGSRGMQYESLPPEQSKLVIWMLDRAKDVLGSGSSSDWTKQWQSVLKQEEERGFHPTIPKFGFGDPTSYRLTQEVIQQTISVGAVRHGAECCNFWFPQELDDQYLVIWHGYQETHSKPWDYLSEEDLRAFLLSRVREGYSFPLNPVWPVRDKGWYEVLQALRRSPDAEVSLNTWFPPEFGILPKIDELHLMFPAGLQAYVEPDVPSSHTSPTTASLTLAT